MDKKRIAFVGVGRMGANMARRLRETGYNVTAVYDVREETARAVAEEIEADFVADLAQVPSRADVIITVVSDDAATRAIFAEDALLADASGKVFINCATISPSVNVEVERLAEAAGARALEACMASSITQARKGTLYLMCGGPKEVYEEVQPILEDLSGIMRYIGPAGSASQVKALVNMVMNINTAGLAEGLGLGEALGLDLTMLREVFSETGAHSRVLQTDGEDMQNRDHECYFSAAHAAKDSGIALWLAEQQGMMLPLAIATKEQYSEMVRRGLGEIDKSGVAELVFKGRGQKPESG
jgi:3-hydroxyisobutyrate dehydrogenase